MVRKNLYFFIGLITLLLFFCFYPFFKRASLKINDSLNYFSYYLFRESPPEDIVVVGIDDYSLRNIPYRWPWKRSIYAKFLDILEEEKARAVCFDLAFVGSSEEIEDEAFAKAIQNFSGDILLSYFVDKQANPIYPFADFKEITKLGLINTPQDEDGLIRRARAYIKKEPFLGKSFSLESARLYLEKEIEIVENGVEIGETFIPLDKNRTYHINYLFKPKDLKYISFFDVLERRFSQGEFKDKFVFVGPVAKIIQDIHPTPFGEFPGVFIHVNGFLNIVKNRFIRDLRIDFLIYILILLSIGIILNRFSFLKGLFLSLGILLSLFWIDVLLFSQGFRFNFGNIFIFSFLYLSFGNLYRYIYSLALLLKIKNIAIRDPMTGLFTPRYLYYLLGIELDKLSLRNLYLICILIDGFKEITKNLDIVKIKEILKEVSNFLNQNQLKGAILSEETIIGFLYFKRDIKGFLVGLRAHMEKILSHREINGRVRVGYLKAYRGILAKDSFLDLFQRLKSSSQDLVEYSEIIKPPATERVLKDTLEFLGKDIEEKNWELVNLVEKLKEEEKKGRRAYFDLITSLLIAIEERDPYTQGHSERIAHNCLLFAERLNLSLEEKQRLREAALLHDIGKIGIPDEILHKKGKLTDEEFNFIKKHISLGIKILEPVSELRDLIPYILYHHEHYDGSGYPYGLSRDMIPLGAQIIGICDTFDALVTGRDYKNASSIEEAIQELERVKAKQFDPKLVDIFKEMVLKKGQ